MTKVSYQVKWEFMINSIRIINCFELQSTSKSIVYLYMFAFSSWKVLGLVFQAIVIMTKHDSLSLWTTQEKKKWQKCYIRGSSGGGLGVPKDFSPKK